MTYDVEETSFLDICNDVDIGRAINLILGTMKASMNVSLLVVRLSNRRELIILNIVKS